MTDQGPPREFAKQVRNALARLHDTAHLQRHPLLRLLVPSELTDPRVRAQYLREAIVQAIGELRPPARVSPHDPAYRPYGILRHRFMEGMEAEEVQDALAIGRRQYYREQQRAIEAVATLLWARRSDDSATDDDRRQALNDELEQLGLQAQNLDLEALTREAIAAVTPLALARDVAIAPPAERPVHAFADEVITRQVLIDVLSALLQRTAHCYLRVKLAAAEPWATVNLEIPMPPQTLDSLQTHLLTPMRLANRVSGSLDAREEDGILHVRLRLPLSSEEVVAIVDDNPTTLQLFRRYLEPYSYRPVLIQDSATALAQIRTLQPDAVVLDIMMRDVDGWRILQSLRADPATSHIPILVCSVLSDEHLALTIGADAYLRKPVSQSELVRALAQALRAADAGPGTSSGRSPASG
ncbi:MAG: response regulator [Anaerolineae bacterium]|nr:response regulator [Anaerolineae bacterium]